MFTWKEIRSWAKSKGYKTERTKIENEENSYHYTWYKEDNPTKNGETKSVSKLATAIFNDITDYAHVEYQKEYALKKEQEEIRYDV